MALSARHARFVTEYMLDGNGAAAAVVAGHAKGSAKVTASRLLANANLQAVLTERQQALRTEHQLSQGVSCRKPWLPLIWGEASVTPV